MTPSDDTKYTNEASKKTIVFLHPDLGIGGAERLVVDAAVGLQQRGHRVVIFTSHCDRGHCFDEVRDGMSLPFPGMIEKHRRQEVLIRTGWG